MIPGSVVFLISRRAYINYIVINRVLVSSLTSLNEQIPFDAINHRPFHMLFMWKPSIKKIT